MLKIVVMTGQQSMNCITHELKLTCLSILAKVPEKMLLFSVSKLLQSSLFSLL